MRILPFFLSTVITVALIIAGDRKWGAIPPLGRFLSPQQGFWQNAEPALGRLDETINLPALKGKATVYLDDRLVPHVFAEHDEDLYFIQGFIHAKYRLWQMEFQTHAAAGRVSEILGDDPRFLRFDREQRRMGMVYAAENALKMIDADTATKPFFDAYTAGVNAYIRSLTPSRLPVEYKLLDYRPEPWSNMKIALFLKLMSKDLAGYERDMEFTNAKSVFSHQQLQLLYPQLSDSSRPIIPSGTPFPVPGVVPVKPAGADSLYFGLDTAVAAVEMNKPDRTNGSNNWAVSGSKTASGAPILSNDPHLNLSLPSIWYEMQLTSPTVNVYGATFPGSPSVIIGFNEQVAFGFTNAMRDVKDYYRIRFQDASRKAYWFNNQWEPTRLKVEEIRIRGAATRYDTVAYTVFGPVMYDETFTLDSTNHTAIAVKWVAHEPSNEGAMWFRLNRARNYDDYLAAIRDFVCPGQNMLFAAKNGDIALWQQALFPARWAGQGLYLMPGEDSSYLWQGYIPQEENPHVVNPASGFIQSANQRPVDSTYPYFIPGNYITPRSVTLEKRLSAMQGITPQDMMRLQQDYFNPFAEVALPLLSRNLQLADLDEKERGYLQELEQWNFQMAPDSKAATVFKAWFDSLELSVWKDDMDRIPMARVFPDEQTLLEALLRDSAFAFIDDRNTPAVETLPALVTQSYKKAVAGLAELELANRLSWSKYKDVSIYHLLRTAVVPFARKGLPVGGWGNTVNAITTTHGPSWRMVIHLSPDTEAYGIYPGGQSGNPGSRFYDNFVDDWSTGRYYTLWMMRAEDAADKRIIGTLSFTNN
jgi:penicillin amidase